MTLAFRQFGELATLCTEFIQSSSHKTMCRMNPISCHRERTEGSFFRPACSLAATSALLHQNDGPHQGRLKSVLESGLPSVKWSPTWLKKTLAKTK